MGSLNLPESGRIYFDANAVIYSVEKLEPFWSVLEPAWQAAKSGRIGIISSELVFLECSVKPIRDSDLLLAQVYRHLLLDSRDVILIPVDFGAIERATFVRAESGLKTPDAIHAATAMKAGAALFVTNDSGFRRVTGLNVAVLSELVNGE